MPNPEINVKIGAETDFASFARAQKEIDDQLKVQRQQAASSLGLQENDPFLQRAQQAWIRAQRERVTEAQRTATEQIKIEQKLADEKAKLRRQEDEDIAKHNRLRSQRNIEWEQDEERMHISRQDRLRSLLGRTVRDVAGTVGGYQYYRGLRAIQGGSNFGSALAGGEEGSLAGGALGGIATGGIMLGLSVAAAGLSAAFNMLKQTGMEVAGALAQIAGAKGLQGLLVGAASQEHAAGLLAANSNMSRSQAVTLMRSMSKRSEFGDDEVGQLLTAVLEKGGGQALNRLSVNGQPTKTSDFLTQMASITTGGVGAVGAAFGDLSKMFPDESSGQLRDKMMQLWALGKETGMQYAENPDMLDRLKAAGEQFGTGFTGQAALAAKLSQAMGGKSRQAVTQLIKLEEASGGNLASSILASGGVGGTPQAALFQQFGQENPGIKASQAAIDQWIRKIEQATDAADQVAQALDKVQGGVDYQLKNAWNQVNEELQPALLSVLKELVQSGAIKQIADAFISHKQDIADGVRDLARALPVLAQAAMTALHMFVPMINKAADFLFPNAMQEAEVAKLKLETGRSDISVFGHPLTADERKELENKVRIGATVQAARNLQFEDTNAPVAAPGTNIPDKPMNSGEPDSSARSIHAQASQHIIDQTQWIKTSAEYNKIIRDYQDTQVKQNAEMLVIMRNLASNNASSTSKNK